MWIDLTIVHTKKWKSGSCRIISNERKPKKNRNNLGEYIKRIDYSVTCWSTLTVYTQCSEPTWAKTLELAAGVIRFIPFTCAPLVYCAGEFHSHRFSESVTCTTNLATYSIIINMKRWLGKLNILKIRHDTFIRTLGLWLPERDMFPRPCYCYSCLNRATTLVDTLISQLTSTIVINLYLLLFQKKQNENSHWVSRE